MSTGKIEQEDKSVAYSLVQATDRERIKAKRPLYKALLAIIPAGGLSMQYQIC